MNLAAVVLFVLTTFLTLYFLYNAANHSVTLLLVIIFWMAIQSAVSLSGFYINTSGLPPRFMLAVIPPLVAILFMFFVRAGKSFIDALNLRDLTILHSVRLPVEIVLFMLFKEKLVPKIMTFEGSNFDILSGITAPVVWYFGYIKPVLGKKVILIWNVICLGLLVNIVTIAVLSAPFEIQKLGFEQPNIAVLNFPYVLLPAFIVPSVLLSHLAAMRKLVRTGI